MFFFVSVPPNSVLKALNNRPVLCKHNGAMPLLQSSSRAFLEPPVCRRHFNHQLETTAIQDGSDRGLAKWSVTETQPGSSSQVGSQMQDC